MVKSGRWTGHRRSGFGAGAVAGGLALAVTLTGCGHVAAARSTDPKPRTSQSVSPRAPGALTPARLTTTPVSNQALAELDARHLLSLLTKLPPGASPLSAKAPAGTPPLLRSPAVRPMTPYLATDTRFTIVPGSPAAILAWFTTHKPAGSTNALSGSTGGPGALALEQAFQWPATAVLDQRDMLLSAETFGQGRSLVRIDTGVVYTPNRPAAERVPAGVDRVVLTVTPPAGPVRVFVVTKDSSIAALESALAALARPDFTVQPGGPCLCGPGVNEKFVAEFFVRGASSPVVTVTDSPYLAIMGVGNVGFEAGMTAEPVLEDWSWSLAKVVEHITGVHFDGVPPASAPKVQDSMAKAPPPAGISAG